MLINCPCDLTNSCSPTLLYTHVHIRFGRHKVKDDSADKSSYEVVPVASEVSNGWWVGSCYGHQLNKDWGGVVDLTVEVSLLACLFCQQATLDGLTALQFPESCRERTKHYLSAPTWDGIPLPPGELELAAQFAVAARKDGDVLVHW